MTLSLPHFLDWEINKLRHQVLLPSWEFIKKRKGKEENLSPLQQEKKVENQIQFTSQSHTSPKCHGIRNPRSHSPADGCLWRAREAARQCSWATPTKPAQPHIRHWPCLTTHQMACHAMPGTKPELRLRCFLGLRAQPGIYRLVLSGCVGLLLEGCTEGPAVGCTDV